MAASSSIASAGSSSSRKPSPAPGTGCSGSMCSLLSAPIGITPVVSISGSRSRSGCSSAAPSPASPRWIASTTTNLRPRSGSGMSGIGGSISSRPTVVIDSGIRGASRCQAAQHLGCPLDRPEHRAGVDLGDRVEPELDGGDDAEVAAAAAQRPEQGRLGVGVGAHQLAVGGDHLDRGDAVGGDAVGAAEPAEPAAERVADHAHVGRRARPVRPGRAPARARSRPSTARRRRRAPSGRPDRSRRRACGGS